MKLIFAHLNNIRLRIFIFFVVTVVASTSYSATPRSVFDAIKGMSEDQYALDYNELIDIVGYDGKLEELFLLAERDNPIRERITILVCNFWLYYGTVAGGHLEVPYKYVLPLIMAHIVSISPDAFVHLLDSLHAAATGTHRTAAMHLMNAVFRALDADEKSRAQILTRHRERLAEIADVLYEYFRRSTEEIEARYTRYLVEEATRAKVSRQRSACKLGQERLKMALQNVNYLRAWIDLPALEGTKSSLVTPVSTNLRREKAFFSALEGGDEHAILSALRKLSSVRVITQVTLRGLGKLVAETPSEPIKQKAEGLLRRYLPGHLSVFVASTDRAGLQACIRLLEVEARGVP